MMQDFLDEALGTEPKREFEAHVSRCPGCAREMKAYRSLDRMLAGMEKATVPQGFAEPIVKFLRATGRIHEREEVRVGRRGLVGWLPAPLRIPAAATVILAVVLAAVSIASGRFLGIVGKGTVAATSVYIEARETVSSVAVLDDVSRELEQNVETTKTIANAIYLLLSAVGRTYLLPASLMLLVFAMAAVWYVRNPFKRSTGHASFSF